jgi:hypothetical protein
MTLIEGSGVTAPRAELSYRTTSGVVCLQLVEQAAHLPDLPLDFLDVAANVESRSHGDRLVEVRVAPAPNATNIARVTRDGARVSLISPELDLPRLVDLALSLEPVRAKRDRED